MRENTVDSSSRPDVIRRSAALIATHGRPTLLRRTLESIDACEGVDVPFEIVVVENGGRHGAEELCGALRLGHPLRYLYVDEPGKSNALNVAIASLDADLIVFFDDDVRVDRCAVRAFAEAAARHGPGSFFGGPVEVDYEEPPPRWLHRYLPGTVVGWTLGSAERIIDTPDFIGTNWAAFRADLLAAGGFAAHLGPNARFRTIGQETEMQKRLLARGARGVFVPRGAATHWVPRERCTLEWALDRWARTHMSRAMENPRRGDLSVAGVPLWLIKQTAGSAARVAANRLLARDWAARIDSEMRHAADRGTLRGYRLARQRERNGGWRDGG